MLRFWQKRQALKRQARALAAAALAASRDPGWYTARAVPDSFDGRFEVAVLELFIRLYRAQTPALNQAAFTAFFRQMELALRELGVGDLSVPRHMKRMMTGFNGRLRHYWAAADAPNRADLIDALARNVYGTAPGTSPDIIENLADHVLKRVQEKGGRHEIAA